MINSLDKTPFYIDFTSTEFTVNSEEGFFCQANIT